MNLRILLLVLLCAVSWVCKVDIASAGDLDDGISQYSDNSIDKDDELGQKDRNIKYIIDNAKSQADVRAKTGIDKGVGGANKSGDGNMNSVILGPGGSVRGDIIIIDQSKGPKTQVVQ